MGRPIRALVVEDDDQMRFLLMRILTRLDAELVTAAASAEEGLSHLMTGDYTLVLTDVGLKGSVNGIEMVQRIRTDANSRHQNVPILVLTGNQQVAVIKAALAAGADSYVVKPVSPATLKQHVDRLMNNRPVRGAAPAPDARAVMKI